MNFKPLILGFCVAVAVSATLFAVFTFMDDKSGLRGPGYLLILLILGFAASVAALIFLGLPIYFLLNRFDLVNVWTAIASGAFVGFVASALTEWPHAGAGAFLHASLSDHAIRRIFAHTIMGAVSALCFWLFSLKNKS